MREISIYPPGCFVNYDLAIVDFLLRLQGQGPTTEYQALRDSLGRRPTLAEFWRSGASISEMRWRFGQWWALLRAENDLIGAEAVCLDHHDAFFREVESMAMSKCFKAVLLESMLDLDGFRQPPRTETLARQALEVFRRRRRFIADIRAEFRDVDTAPPAKWLSYWRGNPINAWVGGNRRGDYRPWFEVRGDYFAARFTVSDAESAVFESMLRELVDYRLAAYEPRLGATEPDERLKPEPTSAVILPFARSAAAKEATTELPFFPDLRIACGHFRTGRTDVSATCRVPAGYGRLDPQRHFVARAIGNSMNGGKNPVQDGDFLLLEWVDPDRAGSITGSVMAIERQDIAGDDQYVLRRVTKRPDGTYLLKATNPAYEDFEASEDFRPLAGLGAVLPRLDGD